MFLPSGEKQQSLSFSFRIGKQSVSRIRAKACEAIYLLLKDIYLKSTKTPEQWENISSKFEELLNFPHMLGAIDDKHIRIKIPIHFETLYHN